MDEARSASTATGSACGAGATLQAQKGGYALQALKTIGDIVLPEDGGAVTLSGSSPGPPLPEQVNLTFTATVSEG